jgi:hypothetical protein
MAGGVATIKVANLISNKKKESFEVQKTSLAIHPDILSKWKIDANNLSIHFDQELGRGAFAHVCKG